MDRAHETSNQALTRIGKLLAEEQERQDEKELLRRINNTKLQIEQLQNAIKQWEIQLIRRRELNAQSAQTTLFNSEFRTLK